MSRACNGGHPRGVRATTRRRLRSRVPTPLTNGQRRVLSALMAGWAGGWPSLREVGALAGIRSTNGVAAHVEALYAKGALVDYANPPSLVKTRVYMHLSGAWPLWDVVADAPAASTVVCAPDAGVALEWARLTLSDPQRPRGVCIDVDAVERWQVSRVTSDQPRWLVTVRGDGFAAEVLAEGATVAAAVEQAHAEWVEADLGPFDASATTAVPAPTNPARGDDAP